MRFTWCYENKESQLVRSFLKNQGISKRLLAKIKFQGGQITVNGTEQNVLYTLEQGDEVEITIPVEEPHETLLADPVPLAIVYEDRDLLVVDKPAGVASIPSQYHPNGTMANRVKHYYVTQGYADQVVHVVTRLDRDTSGLMLFAKHGFAHSLLDQQLRTRQLEKIYTAIVEGAVSQLHKHDEIVAPIGRDLYSLMKRQITSEGKAAHTEYWLEKRTENYALVRIRLHTGRTHQIRVHFASLDCPLAGDDMYGGSANESIQRQALHCSSLTFIHPFSRSALFFEAGLPADMKCFADKLD